MQSVTEQAVARVVQCGGGFIARRFNSENQHAPQSSVRRRIGVIPPAV
jgi:hypothetical protein